MKELQITKQDQNQRLDKYLLRYFNKAPKSFLYKMLRKKRIKYNGKKAEGNEIIVAGDTVQLYLSEETMAEFIEQKKISVAERHFGIVYENDDLLIVNKPAGLLTHPERNDDRQTLIDQICYYLYEKCQYMPEHSFTPATCNRLDRNTSGIVIAGKNLQTVQSVSKAIREKHIAKYYVALVAGNIEQSGEINLYLAKQESHNQVRTSTQQKEGYQKALTIYTPLCYNKQANVTLLQLQLITGKTHQLRAHLSAIGHPIWGDRKYGDVTINQIVRANYAVSHQCLHAQKIIWQEREGLLSQFEGTTMTAPLPKQMYEICVQIFGQETVTAKGL